MATARNQTVNRMSPRQKMINLMYIVLTAMLALNVSSDVLNGFSQVEDSLTRSNRTISARNQALYAELVAYNDKNNGKGQQWVDKATEVKAQTDSLYNYIESLKEEIVKISDGPGADVNNIKNKDNLDAASQVMLPPTSHKGEELRGRIDDFRNYITSFFTDDQKRENVSSALSTEPMRNGNGEKSNKKWEETMFENMPTIAAVTLLTKLQNDVRYAEGELLSEFLASVDMDDLRVNLVDAFVVPQSRIVMRGTKYSANIVMAAIDTLQRPVVYVNGHRLANDRGLYEVGTGAAGTYDYSGWIEVVGRDGTVTRRDFKSSYTVIDPIATVSATMMNVFYAGINNPVSIAVPGVPMENISASMTNGSLTRSGDGWIAHPTQVGAQCVITVTAMMDGQQTNVGSATFRVRKLPDPLPFIKYTDAKGNENRYKGGKPISKTILLGAKELDAAIDDDLLNIDYRVLSFQTIVFDQMGNAIPENSSGAQFSQRQIDRIKGLQRGKRFFITSVKATGPDGIQRDLAPMEVIVQ